MNTYSRTVTAFLIFALSYFAAVGLAELAGAEPAVAHRPAGARTTIIVHDLVYPDRGPFPIAVDSVPAVGELVRIDDETFLVKHVRHDYTDASSPTITIFLVRPGGLVRGPNLPPSVPELP